MIVDATDCQKVRRNCIARYIRSASVKILIIASSPTKKKDPTRAIYSALSMIVSCLFHNRCATIRTLKPSGYKVSCTYIPKRPRKGIGAMVGVLSSQLYREGCRYVQNRRRQSIDRVQSQSWQPASNSAAYFRGNRDAFFVRVLWRYSLIYQYESHCGY